MLAREGKSRAMDVAVALGADPATMLSGVLPLPEDLDGIPFCRLPLRQDPWNSSNAKRWTWRSLPKPKSCSKAMLISTTSASKGPSATIRATISLQDKFPAFHLTCITPEARPYLCFHRRRQAPMEDYWMGYAVERLFLPCCAMQMPGGCGRAYARRRGFPQYDSCGHSQELPSGHAPQSEHAIWGLPAPWFTKCIVVVDHDVNAPRCAGGGVEGPEPYRPPERDIQFTLGPWTNLKRLAPCRTSAPNGCGCHPQVRRAKALRAPAG